MKNRIVAMLMICCLLFGFTGCAAKNYQQLSSADRHNAEDWLKMANLLYRLRDYGVAADYYEKIVTNYPDTIYFDIAEKRLKKAQNRHLQTIKSY